MPIRRMEHVGIVVEDLAEFFVDREIGQDVGGVSECSEVLLERGDHRRPAKAMD